MESRPKNITEVEQLFIKKERLVIECELWKTAFNLINSKRVKLN